MEPGADDSPHVGGQFSHPAEKEEQHLLPNNKFVDVDAQWRNASMIPTEGSIEPIISMRAVRRIVQRFLLDARRRCGFPRWSTVRGSGSKARDAVLLRPRDCDLHCKSLGEERI